MLSESARMTTAEEARYRIDYPNSKPRAVKVIALDAPSEVVVKRLAQGNWQRATFLTALKFDGAPRGGEGWSMQAWLSDLAGRTKDLVDEVATADLVVMVASAGTGADVAAVIAEACANRRSKSASRSARARREFPASSSSHSPTSAADASGAHLSISTAMCRAD